MDSEKHYEHVIRPISDLIPYINNSRTHSAEQVNQVASSMKEFGFTNPVLIDEQGGVIAGHGRIQAAQKLKYNEVPCIILSGLTDAQKKAYVIADNQLALNSGWDMDKLAIEVESLKEVDFDIDLLGFDDDFLGELLPDPINDGLTDEDEVPEVEDNPVSVLGDIWELGDHRLMCGSSSDQCSVEILLNGQNPNTMITDPPYGVEYEADWRAKAKGRKKTDREDSSSLKNDNQADWFEVYDIFTGGVAYVWHADVFTDVIMDGLKRAVLILNSKLYGIKTCML